MPRAKDYYYIVTFEEKAGGRGACAENKLSTICARKWIKFGTHGGGGG